MLARMIEIRDKQRGSCRPGAPFRCLCGAVGDPFNPGSEKMHREHVFVARSDRLTR
jgi:hypothetical protein